MSGSAIGWVTAAEQAALRQARRDRGPGRRRRCPPVDAGEARHRRFHIADFDTFDIVNFNRQVRRDDERAGRAQADVLARMARDINPGVELVVFDDGVTDANRAAFLGADVYVDGLNFFAFAARRAVFAACRARRVPGGDRRAAGHGGCAAQLHAANDELRSLFRPARRHDGQRARAAFPRRLVAGDAAAALPGRPDDCQLRRQARPVDDHRLSVVRGVAAAETLKILLVADAWRLHRAACTSTPTAIGW